MARAERSRDVAAAGPRARPRPGRSPRTASIHVCVGGCTAKEPGDGVAVLDWRRQPAAATTGGGRVEHVAWRRRSAAPVTVVASVSPRVLPHSWHAWAVSIDGGAAGALLRGCADLRGRIPFGITPSLRVAAAGAAASPFWIASQRVMTWVGSGQRSSSSDARSLLSERPCLLVERRQGAWRGRLRRRSRRP
jgi:hypothetical protein